MFRDAKAFTNFSTNDVEAAREFYGETLGLDVEVTEMGFLSINLADGHQVTVYPKPNHKPATFTVLNFVAPDVEKAVDDLAAAGIAMEQYDMPEIKTDPKGIARDDDSGTAIAWFKDPAGNILAVLETPDGR